MRVFIFIILFLPLTLFSQFQSKLERHYSDTLPQKFIIDKDKLREHIFNGVPKNIRQGEHARKVLDFSHSTACEISDLISSGSIYSNWSELEDYVNEIVKKIMPDELKGDSMIHVYVIREGDYNAFMTPSGHAFVNIGLLPETPNEAALAGVLCHELAHYYLRHSLNEFLAEETSLLGLSDKRRRRHSVNAELQADSLAAVWLHKSGYNIQGLISSFKTMYRLERNELKKMQDEWTLKETTHPLSQKRLDKLTLFYNKNKANLGKNFLVDEAKFYRLREEVKPEILKSFISNFDYYDCIEQAFKYHLFEPDNSVYVYYIMEGIRRQAYLNVDVWKEKFITNNYYDSLETNGHRHKEKMTDHLFKKFDLDIITIDPIDGVKLKARFYWKDQPRFTTYEEAYNFFNKLGEALKCKECVLSNALSYTSKSEKERRIQLLKTYLSYDSILHKDFAQNVLDNTIYQKLSTKKIIAFDNLDVTIKQGYENITVPDKKNFFKQIIDSLMLTQKNKTAFYLPEFKMTHLNDYNSIVAAQIFSLIPIVAKGEQTELHILDPNYWELFHKYNVNEIEFVFPFYYEVRAKETDIASYQKIINTDFNGIMGRTNYQKYMDLPITSLRCIANRAMKIRYYGEENKLNSKENTSDQIKYTINYGLSIKDVKAKEKDYQFIDDNKR